MSATPEIPPVETIPLGLGFDAYGYTRGDILARISEVQAMTIQWNETAIAIIFAYVVAMFVAAHLLSRLQFALATVLYLAAIAGCYMQMMTHGFILRMYETVLWGDAPALNLEWWDENVPSWFYLVGVYLEGAIQLGSVLLSVYLGWRFRKNPPQDRLNLPEAMQKPPKIKEEV
jgi:hypothetical protein